MLKYRDFVPKQIAAPGLFAPGEHESFDEAVGAANQWLQQSENIKLIGLETVVLPNIWSKWEEGSTDASIGTSGDSPSRWHQFLRCWYQETV
ncbi:MAG: hypothetical protein AAGA30_07495 [Planctomycetota bacterium]